jgi:hypothetical protein
MVVAVLVPGLLLLKGGFERVQAFLKATVAVNRD